LFGPSTPTYEESIMSTTPTCPEGTVIPDASKPERYTRSLRFSELFKAAYVLSMGIARLADEMISTQNGTSKPQSWDELRNSSEALAAIADHVCNDARYWDDDEDDTPAGRRPANTKKPTA